MRFLLRSQARSISPILPEIPGAALDLDFTAILNALNPDPESEKVKKRAINVLKLSQENEKLKEELKCRTYCGARNISTVNAHSLEWDENANAPLESIAGQHFLFDFRAQRLCILAQSSYDLLRARLVAAEELPQAQIP
ncbi:hypothetical protein C8R44DRAFT_869400 [Mycena epipterygia]|nr:hypothetical protein C8R44DRAFT_869400 [Mycena epipterygia]